VLDAIADYVETRRRLAEGGVDADAVEEQLNQIGHRYFSATQSLQAVLDDPHR
jgi:hypothetical protein